jgi:tryptophan synthase alpha subunit
VAGIADGVIVGSAIVKRQGDAEELRAFIESLCEAVRVQT